jgi:hypothetical protein
VIIHRWASLVRYIVKRVDIIWNWVILLALICNYASFAHRQTTRHTESRQKNMLAERQTDRKQNKTDRPTNSAQTDRQTDNHAYRKTDKKNDSMKGRRGRQTAKHRKNRQTYKQTEKADSQKDGRKERKIRKIIIFVNN